MSSSGKQQSSIMLALLPLVILYVCSVVLFAMAREDLAGTTLYWEIAIPLVAVISLIIGWSTVNAREDSRLFYLVKQVLIWGGLVWMLMLFQTMGFHTALGEQKTTITLIFLLAFVSLLVGLQLDWKMFFYGAFLALCAYLLADASHLVVLGKIGDTFGVADAQGKPLTMIIGIALAAFLISTFILISNRGAIMARRNRSS